jgi:hypothetical protein
MQEQRGGLPESWRWSVVIEQDKATVPLVCGRFYAEPMTFKAEICIKPKEADSGEFAHLNQCHTTQKVQKNAECPGSKCGGLKL